MASLQFVVGTVVVLLTLLPSTSLGANDNVDSELLELIEQLREQVAEEKKDKVQTRHDNVNEVRYRADYYYKTHESKRADIRQATLSTADQQTLLNAVNAARSGIGATDMNMLHWNDKLASLAQQWATACSYTHGAPLFDLTVVGFGSLGQNNFAFTGAFDANAAIADWLSEKPNYVVATGDCTPGQGCSRYRQLTWAMTTDIGCALATCPSIAGLTNGNFLVCYFGPPGNFDGEFAYHVSKSGAPAPCTQCRSGQFYCNNGLCDTTCTSASSTCVCKAACKNCGTQQSDCSCKCNDGSVGVDCSNRCHDWNINCGTSWPVSLCYIFAEQCPKLCGTCTDVDPCAAGASQSVPSSGSAQVPAQLPAPQPGPVASAPAASSSSSAASSASSGSVSGGPAPVDPSQNLAHGLTPAQQQRFVFLHNQYRAAGGASNVNSLVWNDQLARVAQEWSDRCIFEHRGTGAGQPGYIVPASVGFAQASIGENIAAYSDNTNTIPDKPMEDWYEEKAYYNFNTQGCSAPAGKSCGHYIAVMWSETVAVGCGFTKCASVQMGSASYPGGVMIACNYAPGADPQKPIFQVGPPCTTCTSGHLFCTNNMCDSTCTAVGSGSCACNVNCANGVSNPSTCSCKCNDGYMGAQCNAPCQDLDPQCENSWPSMFCNLQILSMASPGAESMYGTIQNSCPKMCNKCVAAKRRYHVSDRRKTSRHHHHHHHGES